jgi:acetyl esterase/lipase
MNEIINAAGASAEAPDALGIVRIYPGNGVPPGSESWTHSESTMQAPWATVPRRLSRNIDPARVGIAGFSAGGGVAMGTVLNEDATTRPDFACGVYPAYRASLPMPADAPPLFLVISDDDRSVSPLSAIRLYENWHKAGRSAELHIFGNGAHGWGMAKEGFLSDPWIDLFANWLKARGLLRT